MTTSYVNNQSQDTAVAALRDPPAAARVSSDLRSPVPVLPTGRRVSKHRGIGKLLGIVLLLLALLVGLGAVGTLPRLQRERELTAAAAEAARTAPAVSVVAVRIASANSEHLLPGNCLPLIETTIYARTNGYLKRRLVDIGDNVEAGDLLAEIETPEVDDQLTQLRATLVQTQANHVRDSANQDFNDIQLERLRGLLAKGTIAHEDFDRQVAATQVARATVHATEANIRLNEADIQRLTDLQSYQKITAPYRGIITLRNYDAGALMIADNASILPMFRLSQIDTLRVMVAVPQVYSTTIRVGQVASVFRREDPQRKIVGKVTRMAKALDPNTRTMLTEVQIPNLEYAMLPGMYLQVKFKASSEVPQILLPPAALVTRAEGISVPILDDKNVVHYRTVELGRDYGSEVEILSGLKGGETVVVHPGDTLPEGKHVNPVTATKDLVTN